MNGTTQGAAPAGSATESAGRVADVLALFGTTSRPLGVSECARSLGLAKSVTHRIFQSLVQRKFLEPDEETRSYRLGPAAVALGAWALGRSDLRAAAAPVLRSLRDATGETTTVSLLVDSRRIYLDQFISREEVKMSVELGPRHPLHAGSSGKSILAFLPTSELEAVLAEPLTMVTGSTITDVAALRAELDRVRRRGYADSHGERLRDAGSVAAPVFNLYGEVIGSISVCGPAARMPPLVTDEFAPQVVAAAATISRTLGHRPHLHAADEAVR